MFSCEFSCLGEIWTLGTWSYDVGTKISTRLCFEDFLDLFSLKHAGENDAVWPLVDCLARTNRLGMVGLLWIIGATYIWWEIDLATTVFFQQSWKWNMAKQGEENHSSFVFSTSQSFWLEFTLPETHSSPLKIGHPKREASIFQQSILRCENVSFRKGTWRIIPWLVSGDRITPIYKPFRNAHLEGEYPYP